MYFKIYKSQKPKTKIWIRVSKQVSKSAVARNKIKRRIRRLLDMYSSINTDYIISALPGIDKATFLDLALNLSYTLKKQGII